MEEELEEGTERPEGRELGSGEEAGRVGIGRGTQGPPPEHRPAWERLLLLEPQAGSCLHRETRDAEKLCLFQCYDP